MNHLPLNNLSYPIRLEFTDSVGTGFFINYKGKAYLVSAGHNFIDSVENKYEFCIAIAYTSDIRKNKTWRLAINILESIANNHFFENVVEDVAVIYIGDIDGLNIKIPNEVKVIEAQDEMLISVKETAIREIEDVIISADVFVLGYPVSIGLEDMPQIDFEKPLVKKGSVAGINFDKKTIILDCEIYKGNSGSPVIQGVQIDLLNTEYKLIGVIVEYVAISQRQDAENIIETGKEPYVNSGYSIAVAMNVVLDLIR